MSKSVGLMKSIVATFVCLHVQPHEKVPLTVHRKILTEIIASCSMPEDCHASFIYLKEKNITAC